MYVGMPVNLLKILFIHIGERSDLGANASDSGSRGRGFEPSLNQTVLCPRARHFNSLKVLVIPKKLWLHPIMTEKLFTGTLRINQPTNCLYTKKKLCFQHVSIYPHQLRNESYTPCK